MAVRVQGQLGKGSWAREWDWLHKDEGLVGTNWLHNEKGLTVEPGQLGGSRWARDWPCEAKARARAAGKG